jgi:hypothetical protein
MEYEIGSSSTNPERHREGQLDGSSSRRRDIIRDMSNTARRWTRKGVTS